jgi:hypothetical protein
MSYAVVVLLSLAGFAAQSSTAPDSAGFAIYCVKAERPHGGAVALGELVLEQPPYLTQDQVESYDWESHTIHVAPGALRDEPEAQEFVVMAHGLRIYRGYFSHHFSSRGYFGSPVIFLPFIPAPDGEVHSLPGRDTLLQIQLWGNEDGDPRFDKRLYDYLASAGLLAADD